MGVKAEGMLRFDRVNKVTSASLGYPLPVFNKNSTLIRLGTLVSKIVVFCTSEFKRSKFREKTV